MIPVRFLFHAKYKTLMNLRLERIESIVLFILSLLLILKISFPIFIFPFVFSILSFFEVKIKKLHFISINFVLFSFFSYMQGYYFIPAIILLLILFYTEEFDKNEILKSFIFCFIFLFFFSELEYSKTLNFFIAVFMATSISFLEREINILKKEVLLFYFLSFFLLISSPGDYNLNFIGFFSILIFILGFYRYNIKETFYMTTFSLMICFFLSLQDKFLYSFIFLIPYLLLFRVNVIFDSKKLLKSFLSVIAFWVIYYSYGMTYTSMLYGFLMGCVVCIVPFYASIATILILALNPIEYRFAGEVVVLSLLLYGLYPVFKERLHLDKTLVYYQASFFLLIGAFLSLEKSLFYFLVLLLPYILVMKETIIFDSEKILKITFSILGFWIILLKFNDLGYLGLFFSFSAGMLIYLLNDIIEED